MTTFQTIVYSIIEGFAQFLPISASAHHRLIPYILDWPAPSGYAEGALALGSTLALFFYFRHDWASILSSWLQTVLFWRRPLALDERMPYFILAASAPLAFFWWNLRDPLAALVTEPLGVAGVLVVASLLLWLATRLNRRNKHMVDWNLLDALVVGITQVLALIPGASRQAVTLTAAFWRGFDAEASAKFVFYTLAPLLVGKSVFLLQGLGWRPSDAFETLRTAGVNPWNFLLSVAVTCGAGFLAIGGVMKNLQTRGINGYLMYCMFLAGATIATHFLRQG